MPKGVLSWRKLGVLAGLTVLLLVCVVIIIDQFVLPLVVGSGNVVEVPNVVSKNIDEALSMIAAAGLTTTEPMEQYSETVARGHVISQMPFARASVKQNRRIYLTISRGVETIRMPSLIGKTLRDARLTLIRQGLQVGDIAYEYNDSIPSDRIIVQGVPPGAEIPAGGVTSVVISRGSGTTSMPDVLGMSLMDAESLLKERGFTIGNVKHVASGTFEPNTVIGQDPSAETRVPHGSTVALVIVR